MSEWGRTQVQALLGRLEDVPEGLSGTEHAVQSEASYTSRLLLHENGDGYGAGSVRKRRSAGPRQLVAPRPEAVDLGVVLEKVPVVDPHHLRVGGGCTRQACSMIGAFARMQGPLTRLPSLAQLTA